MGNHLSRRSGKNMNKNRNYILYIFIESEHENLSPDIIFCIDITMLNDYPCKIRTFLKSGQMFKIRTVQTKSGRTVTLPKYH